MDFLYIFEWWLSFFALGLIFLPVSFLLFEKLNDKGYIISKAIGLISISYILWLLSSFKIISFAKTNMYVVMLVCFIINIIVLLLKRDFFKKLDYKSLLKSSAVTELLFLAGLIFWSLIRGFQPDVNSLEKFMDYGFINAVLRADYMPAADIWYAGNGINYYYFGHFICATFIKFSRISPEIGYNLWIGTLFGMLLSFTYSITSNIMALYTSKKKTIRIASLISAIMMVFAGNLHTFFEGVIGNLMKGKAIFEGYWYPNATRYVGYEGSFLPNFSNNDKTIHEFPSYSLIVADLHAHFIDLIIVLTIVSLIIAYVIRMTDNLEQYEWYRPTKEMPMLILLLASAYIANAWDFPMYLMFTGIALLAINFKKYGFKWKTLYASVLVAMMIGIVAFALDTPFHLNFKNIAQGIGFGVLKSAITGPDKFFILWGHFLFMTISLVWVIVKQFLKSLPRIKIGKKMCLNMKGIKLINKFFAEISTSDLIALCILLCAVVLIYLPEIVYVRDIYEAGYPRSNTMFKLVYQGYTLFTLVIGYAFFRLRDGIKILKQKKWINILMIFAIALPLLYPLPKPLGGASIEGYYKISTPNSYKGLDGLRFIKEKYNDDYIAIQWLNKNVSGQPVILEANGDSYSEYGRISMATGLPTIFGWKTHEWLWRGDIKAVDERIKEVKTIYESDNAYETREILEKYNVKYIVIGELEANQFKSLKTQKLLSMGTVVFQSNKTKIIAL